MNQLFVPSCAVLLLLLGVPAIDWWARVLVGKFKPWKDWRNDDHESVLHPKN